MMDNVAKLITEKANGIQEQIDSCVSSIREIAPMAYSGEQGMKELLSELGQSLTILQAQRRVLQELLDESTPQKVETP